MQVSLKIRDLRVEDSGSYYCQVVYRWRAREIMGAYGSEWATHTLDGEGTTVTVMPESVSPASQSPERQATLADSVTLSCKYHVFCRYTLHWYRQLLGQFPVFLLQAETFGAQDKKKNAGERFTSFLDTSKKISHLTISEVQVSDAAMYYCALSLFTHGGNTKETKLVFANGTKLIVKPRKKSDKPPELSILYPPLKISPETHVKAPAAVCLASNFYPEEVELNISRGSQSDLTRKSVVTDDGYYSTSNYLPALANGDPANVTCTVGHGKSEIKKKVHPVNKPETVTSKPCEAWTSNDKMKDIPEENSMSLTVIGLRILFLKSVAFNVMMTARAWII